MRNLSKQNHFKGLEPQKKKSGTFGLNLEKFRTIYGISVLVDAVHIYLKLLFIG